ncbi:MAG: DUF721 domain-containing protein [Pseudoflavonifractor sp.]|nr:DUF721 domain-containing protein [Alloprevotella sp.]MCM1116951.1 DUF721 domain-containing protein [Pseudoflavonifractor sp.]
MKRTEAESIRDIIDRVVAQAGLTETMAAQRACYLWPEVMGPGVNRYTLRRYVEGSTLHVYITSAPLRNELSFMRQAIVRNLNAAAGSDALTDIIFH